MQGETFTTRWLQLAATLLALGAPFPEITKTDFGRAEFHFADPTGEWAWQAQEFDLDDPDGVRSRVAAKRLFIATDQLRGELDRLCGRSHFTRKPR